MLDLMRDIILATDLAHHLRIFKDLQKMAEGATPRHWGGMGGLAPTSAHLNICHGSGVHPGRPSTGLPDSTGVLCAPTVGQAVGPLLSEGTGAWTFSLTPLSLHQWAMTERTNSTTGFSSASS